MVKNSELLASLGTPTAEWKIDYFTRLEQEMVELEAKMKDIRKDPGWTGESAEAARARVQEFELQFASIQDKLKQARSAIDSANDLRVAAAAKYASLPSASIPWEVQLLIGAATAGSMVTVPFVGIFAAEIVRAKVAEFYGAKREAAAYDELVSLEGQLKAPSAQLYQARISTAEWPEVTPEPWQGEPVTWNGDSNGNGGWSTGGYTGGGGGGGGGGIYVPPTNYPPRVFDPPPPPPGDPDGPDGPDGPGGPTISVDSDGTGVTGGGSGSFMSGGGLSSGLAGAGAGAGALGAGAKLAAGGLGAGALLGGGAGGSGAGAGAGAGGSRNSAMMGGAPGGGGGGGEKEKRTGLGLMAPKLEDDEETGPRAAAAGAGGRD